MKKLLASLTVLTLCSAALAEDTFQTVSIVPSQAVTIYNCRTCNKEPKRYQFYTFGGYVHALAKYPTDSIQGAVVGAHLELHQAAAPTFGPSVYIYGVGSNDNEISASNINTNTLVGTIPLADDDAIISADPFIVDVTQFVANTHFPYLQFDLLTWGSADFTTTSPLVVTTIIPEPATTILLAVSMLPLSTLRRKRS
jgi:hypothetical protein